MKMVPRGGLEPPSLTATRLKLVVFSISPTRVLKIQINDSGWNCTNCRRRIGPSFQTPREAGREWLMTAASVVPLTFPMSLPSVCLRVAIHAAESKLSKIKSFLTSSGEPPWNNSIIL